MTKDLTTPHSSALSSEVKIYVAGHRGLVGSAIVRQLEAEGCRNLLPTQHIQASSSMKT